MSSSQAYDSLEPFVRLFFVMLYIQTGILVPCRFLCDLIVREDWIKGVIETRETSLKGATEQWPPSLLFMLSLISLSSSLLFLDLLLSVNSNNSFIRLIKNS